MALGLLALLVFYVGFQSFAVWISIHPPRVPLFFSPGSAGLPQEDILISSDVGDLRGWLVEIPDMRAVGVIAHGYCMNRSEVSSVAVQFAQWGIGSVLFDFRALGQSPGTRCTIGWDERKDVVAVLEWTRKRFPNLPIIVFGSSMGASAAAFGLAEKPDLADILILDSAYSRLGDAIAGWWRFLLGRWWPVMFLTRYLAGPVAGLNPYQIDTAAALARIAEMPVLVLHGEADSLVRIADAERNFSAIPGSQKEFVRFAGCNHVEARLTQPAAFFARVRTFLDHHLPGNPDG